MSMSPFQIPNELGGIIEMDNGRSMHALKDGLLASSGEGEESEEPRSTCGGQIKGTIEGALWFV